MGFFTPKEKGGKKFSIKEYYEKNKSMAHAIGWMVALVITLRAATYYFKEDTE